MPYCVDAFNNIELPTTIFHAAFSAARPRCGPTTPAVDSAMPTELALAIFALVTILMVGDFVISRRKKAQRAEVDARWQLFGAAHNLEFTGSYPNFTLTGIVDGVGVAVEFKETQVRSNHSKTREFTCLVTATPACDLEDLYVADQKFLTTIAEQLGIAQREVQIDDASFDAKYRILTYDADLARHVLTPDVRQKFIAAKTAWPDVFISAGKIRWSGQASLVLDPDSGVLFEIIGHLAAVASRIPPTKAVAPSLRFPDNG